MALLTRIKFRVIHNRPVDDLKTSPGSFSIFIENKKIRFDFMRSSGSLEKASAPQIAWYSESELDTQTFPESYQLTYEFMSAHPFVVTDAQLDLSAYDEFIAAAVDIDSVKFIFDNGKTLRYKDVPHNPVCKYRLLFKVEGRVEVNIVSNSEESAVSKAQDQIRKMDFGKLRDIEWDFVRSLG